MLVVYFVVGRIVLAVPFNTQLHQFLIVVHFTCLLLLCFLFVLCVRLRAAHPEVEAHCRAMWTVVALALCSLACARSHWRLVCNAEAMRTQLQRGGEEKDE